LLLRIDPFADLQRVPAHRAHRAGLELIDLDVATQAGCVEHLAPALSKVKDNGAVLPAHRRLQSQPLSGNALAISGIAGKHRVEHAIGRQTDLGIGQFAGLG
jgi:hypothetical protein